jgi:hypothetical protein
MGGFCFLVELHRDGSAPVPAGLFMSYNKIALKGKIEIENQKIPYIILFENIYLLCLVSLCCRCCFENIPFVI